MPRSNTTDIHATDQGANMSNALRVNRLPQRPIQPLLATIICLAFLNHTNIHSN